MPGPIAARRGGSSDMLSTEADSRDAGKARARRGRAVNGWERLWRVAAIVLVVLGGLGLVLTSTGAWLERNLLDTGRFTGTANAILDQPEVQRELTHVLVEKLSSEAGTDLRIAEPFLASVVTQVVNSGAFRAVFDRAVSSAHRVVVDESTGTVILDLTNSYDQIKGPLQQVAPKLADQLPSRRQLNVVLLHRSQLTTAWDVIDEVKRAVDIVAASSVVLLVAGVALARARWRAVALAAWVVAGGLAVLLLGLVIGRLALEARIADGGVSDAVGAAFRVMTRSLLVQSVVLGVIGAVIALAARFTDRHGRTAWAPTVRSWWAWLQGALPRAVDASDGLPASAGVFARVRLPQPRVESRAVHGWRAVALLVLGLFAVLDPSGVITVLVVVLGVGVLYLAVTEGIAAASSPTPEHQ